MKLTACSRRTTAKPQIQTNRVFSARLLTTCKNSTQLTRWARSALASASYVCCIWQTSKVWRLHPRMLYWWAMIALHCKRQISELVTLEIWRYLKFSAPIYSMFIVQRFTEIQQRQKLRKFLIEVIWYHYKSLPSCKRIVSSNSYIHISSIILSLNCKIENVTTVGLWGWNYWRATIARQRMPIQSWTSVQNGKLWLPATLRDMVQAQHHYILTSNYDGSAHNVHFKLELLWDKNDHQF